MWRNGFLQGLLLVLVITGALSVVTSQHQARKLFIALQQEKEHAHQMEIEWGQLQLEQSTLAASARVERVATKQLQMQLPKKEQIKLIRVGQSSPLDNGTSHKP
ncbi:MAG TPA: cell division protein FtsL [Gallionella sp.]|jgi:cell division protein FtsL|uniref:Cell division protein FtsL n=1 Tax=Gallionella capsiferriformans (strain ES-2) TaxID=395494 RepID=D9SJM1_GALCS|nr:cell division protein FtsL [Gallionella capsiferriformans]MDP1871242.1 cell division protein FtsL [Gallionella sp.]OGS66314.1 MAG: cell division protein FtsL [Gallionellales bacterium GWA2_54_124]OGT20645.1 MAG: cell division protein FtsL [Gallionellales bacterium RIFOXYD12_FULL_53_10]ADL54371.1 cell division protein FtsL [Gallionella capsiferriformans ES-2]HCI52732.1 cell division protein FtsL [Gallionella sp.]